MFTAVTRDPCCVLGHLPRPCLRHGPVVWVAGVPGNAWVAAGSHPQRAACRLPHVALRVGHNAYGFARMRYSEFKLHKKASQKFCVSGERKQQVAPFTSW